MRWKTHQPRQIKQIKKAKQTMSNASLWVKDRLDAVAPDEKELKELGQIRRFAMRLSGGVAPLPGTGMR
jgi:hypothetical protein